jgi:hypothetical protein
MGGCLLYSNNQTKNLYMSNPMRFSGAGAKTSLLLAVSALIVSSAQLVQAIQYDASITVKNVEGTAEYAVKDGSLWTSLRSGSELKAGALIRTPDNAAVDLFFPWSGTVVRLTANSELRVEKLANLSTDIENITDTKLVLLKGGVVGSQRKLPKASTFSIVTTQGEAVIRGTEYYVRADGAISVISGVVNINYNKPGQRGDVKVRIQAGQSFDPVTRTVVTTTPEFLQNIIFDINAVRNNALAFRVTGGATVVVKPATSTSPVVPGAPPPGGPGPAAD